jgi:hypothetical protein
VRFLKRYRRYNRSDLRIAVENANEVAARCKPSLTVWLAYAMLAIAQVFIGKDKHNGL